MFKYLQLFSYKCITHPGRRGNIYVKRKREMCGGHYVVICSFVAMCLSCIWLICKSKYEIFEPKERERERESHVMLKQGLLGLLSDIVYLTGSILPIRVRKKREKYLASKERKRESRWKTDRLLVRWIILTVIFWGWTARVGTDNSPPALSIICDIKFLNRSGAKPWK